MRDHAALFFAENRFCLANAQQSHRRSAEPYEM